MMNTYQNKNVTILKRRGIPGEGTLPDGTKVYKTEKIFVPEYGRYVKCIDYGDSDGHFIYEIPSALASRFPGPVYRCTCGSIAVISGWDTYKKDASPMGLVFMCQEHATQGLHATGGSRWI